MRSLDGGAGELNFVFHVQERQENPTSGASDPYYEDTGKRVRGNLRALTGRELFLANQVHSTEDHVIRIRYVPWLEPKHRLYYRDGYRDKDRYFNITSIKEEPARVYLDLYVTEWTEAPTEAGAANA